MTEHLTPLPQAEMVMRALIRTEFGLEEGQYHQVGRDLLGTPPAPWYVRIQKVGGRSGQLQGMAVLDIEVFAPDYVVADSIAAALEGILLGYPHVVEVGEEIVVIDSVDQNVAPHEIFWDDERVSRILATYVITLRR